MRDEQWRKNEMAAACDLLTRLEVYMEDVVADEEDEDICECFCSELGYQAVILAREVEKTHQVDRSRMCEILSLMGEVFALEAIQEN